MIEFQTSNIWMYISIGIVSIYVKDCLTTRSMYKEDKKEIYNSIESNSKSIDGIKEKLDTIYSLTNTNSGKLDVLKESLLKGN